MTQKYKNARSNEYATSSDFCRPYVEQMNSLYLLSLLLTALILSVFKITSTRPPVARGADCTGTNLSS